MTDFRFGARSWRELRHVRPELVVVAALSLQRTPVDFGVHDGLRTVEEQQENIDRGVSWTMDSKHLPQEDGLAHAIDLVPYVGGRLRWEWEPIYTMIDVVALVAFEQRVRLRWGGSWAPLVHTKPAREQMEAYVSLRISQGRKVRADGPHLELIEPAREQMEAYVSLRISQGRKVRADGPHLELIEPAP